GEVRGQSVFKHVHAAIELSRFLVLRHQRSISRRCVEPGHSRAAGTDSFSESTLRNEFNFQLTGENQFFEELVFTNVGGNHLSNLTCLQQLTNAEVIDAGVVADDRQIANAFIAQGENEVFRDSTQAKAAHHDCCAILDVGNGFTRVTHHLVHTKPPMTATL